jgi:hypothetical protein
MFSRRWYADDPVGESPGALIPCWKKIADFYDEKSIRAVETYRAHRAFYAGVLGVTIGGLVVSMYLPYSKWPAKPLALPFERFTVKQPVGYRRFENTILKLRGSILAIKPSFLQANRKRIFFHRLKWIMFFGSFLPPAAGIAIILQFIKNPSPLATPLLFLYGLNRRNDFFCRSFMP